MRLVAGECLEDELMENKNKMYVKKKVVIYDIGILTTRLNDGPCIGNMTL